LSNRFWRVIDKVLSDNQTTFIKGKLILNGVLIDNELVDEAKFKKKTPFYSKSISRRHTIGCLGNIFKK
jgi:hypothetical protein